MKEEKADVNEVKKAVVELKARKKALEDKVCYAPTTALAPTIVGTVLTIVGAGPTIPNYSWDRPNYS